MKGRKEGRKDEDGKGRIIQDKERLDKENR